MKRAHHVNACSHRLFVFRGPWLPALGLLSGAKLRRPDLCTPQAGRTSYLLRVNFDAGAPISPGQKLAVRLPGCGARVVAEPV